MTDTPKGYSAVAEEYARQIYGELASKPFRITCGLLGAISYDFIDQFPDTKGNTERPAPHCTYSNELLEYLHAVAHDRPISADSID